jgi:two-component system, sensor histidine kinase and response regulator
MLIERVPVGLFSISRDGRILEVNPAMIEILGFIEADDLKNVSIASLWLRPEEQSRFEEIIEREGVVRNFEMEMRRFDGRSIWCEKSARAVYDEAGKIGHYEGVLVDIDTRKRAEDEASRARDRVRDLALETARLRSNFLANMSHEIRTPLAGIIGTGELLLLSELSSEQRRQTETIRSSGELLLTIVNDILDFSKLSADKVELEEIEFDLVELTELLVDSFAVTARAKGIEIALQVDANLPAGLLGDPNRLRQVLNNLVSNAIKFSARGEVMVCALRVEDTANDVLVRFEVIDSGIGIPYEAQGRLFQPFVQAEGSTSRRFGGTGLGLVIAAKLVEQMGGEIGFESVPGKGSSFHFTARFKKGARIIRSPMAPAGGSRFRKVSVLAISDGCAGREATVEPPSSGRIAAALSGPNAGGQPQWRRAVQVLLVDDNPVNRTLGAKQLSVLGYTAEIVDSARRALEVVGNWPFDIVLMDCEMPEMDGYKAVAEIRRLEGDARHTVVIALTAHAAEGERSKCLSAGMDDYLSKPVKLQTLATMLDAWAHRKIDAPKPVEDQNPPG